MVLQVLGNVLLHVAPNKYMHTKGSLTNEILYVKPEGFRAELLYLAICHIPFYAAHISYMKETLIMLLTYLKTLVHVVQKLKGIPF